MDDEPESIELPKPRIKDSLHFEDTEARNMLGQLASWVFFEMNKPQQAFKRISKGPGDFEAERVFMMRKTAEGVPFLFTYSKVTKNASSDQIPKQTEISIRVEVPQPDVKEEKKEFIRYKITYDQNDHEVEIERYYNPTGNEDIDAAKKLITIAKNSDADLPSTLSLYNKELDATKGLNHSESPHYGTKVDIYPPGHRIIPIKRI